MSLLAELRRRHVIRVAVAYAVVAWFIVQAADTLLPNFGAPAWVFKSVASLLALGFPLVLFLSWAYDLTPDGIQKTPDAGAEVAGPAAAHIGRGVSGALVIGLALVALAAAYLTFRVDDPPSGDPAQYAGPGRGAPSLPAAQFNPRSELRLSIPMPEGLEVTGPIAISRDGSQVALSATDEGGVGHIYLRRLDDFALLRVEGSRDGRNPFFSPDGATVGFFARAAIWRAATQGGPPTRLRAATSLIGADWMEDDTLVYSEGLGSPIKRMSADGVALDPVTTLGGDGAYAHVWPQRIPGTQYMLFDRWGGGNGPAMADLKTGTVRSLTPTNTAPTRWSASGHLLFQNWADGLFVTPFEPSAGQTVSLASARFLLGEVQHLGSNAQSVFALSDNGILAYVPAVQNNAQLLSIQADGSTASILEQRAIDYAGVASNIDISRDGRLALIGAGNIVLVDLERKLPRRLTTDDANDQRASFGVDDGEVYFLSNRQDRWKIWRLPTDGSAAPVLAVEHEHSIDDFSIGPAGEVVFRVTHPSTRSDLWVQDPSGLQRALVQTEFAEESPALSPDGRFIAYVSDVSGIREVYLLAASGVGVPLQVTSGGGTAPKWSHDGGLLMYRSGRTILQVTVENGRPTGAAVQRFAARNLARGLLYDLAPDGNSMLAVQVGDGSIPREIRVMTHFFDEIRRVAGEGGSP